MHVHTKVLWELAEALLSEAELEYVKVLVERRPLDYALLIEFDQMLGGPGISNVDCFGFGRYAIPDRDIFRPLQYLDTYFAMVAEESRAEWLTRELIHLSSLHIENLVKRMSRKSRLPLGALLRESTVRSKIDTDLWTRITVFTRIYNDSKHNVSHPKDTHLFSIADTVIAYAVCRRFAQLLYPHVRLTTDFATFERPCEERT